MKKLIMTNWTTLDGFIAGPMGEMDWILGDDQLADYEIGMVSDADTLLLGKKTYQDFAQYWPAIPTSPKAQPWEKVYAEKINALKKVVISHTLQQAT
jgi:dihydrofolate reductase